MTAEEATKTTEASAAAIIEEQPSKGLTTGEGEENDDQAGAATSSCGRCCSWFQFGGSPLAKGYCMLGMARGPLVMSNIFLSSAFIYLAAEQADCLVPSDESDPNSGLEVMEDCPNRVYGFKPTSLVSTIAVISGLLAAFLMPLIGAVVDFTPHRRMVGIMSAALMVAIQAVQAGTVSATWFPMAILQAIVGFIYQIQVLAVYAYLPEMARDVGEKRTRNYQAHFTMTQFSAQATFLIVVIAIGIALGLNDVQTGHLSQAINVLWVTPIFYFGWKLLPNVAAKNTLRDDQSLWTAGFVQNFHTIKSIHKHYNRGLFRYLLAVVFAEAGVNAFTVVSVVYLSDQIGLSGTEIGIFFLITLLGSIPGAFLGAKVTARLNPVRSWQIGLSCLVFVTIGGSIILDNSPKVLSYIWGIVIGVFLGWHYPTEGLIFSMCLPQGREAELSGFFVYCTQILGWAPPLAFSALVEADVSQTYGVWSVTVFIVIAILIMQTMAPWPEVLEESRKPDPRKEAIAEAEETGKNASVDDISSDDLPATAIPVGMPTPPIFPVVAEDNVDTADKEDP